MELCNAIKTRLSNNMLFVPKTNMFSLEGITEEEFIQAVNECDTEKRQEYEGVKEYLSEEIADTPQQVFMDEVEETPVESTWEYLMQTFKLPELKAMCRENKWKGWSQLRKPDLARFIVASKQ